MAVTSRLAMTLLAEATEAKATVINTDLTSLDASSVFQGAITNAGPVTISGTGAGLVTLRSTASNQGTVIESNDASNTTTAFPLECRHSNSAGVGGTLMGAGLLFSAESTTEGNYNSLGSVSAQALTNAFGTQDGEIRLRTAVAGTNTDIVLVSNKRVRMTQAPNASADHGMVNLGDQGFVGGGGTAFAGSASGTGLASNFASGFAGNHVDLQLAGAAKFRVSAAGVLFLAGSLRGIAGGVVSSTATIAPSADADYTVLAADYIFPKLVVNTGSWTASHSLILPSTTDGEWHIINNTGFIIVAKATTGASISIAVARAATVRWNGTNMRRVTSDVDFTT